VIDGDLLLGPTVVRNNIYFVREYRSHAANDWKMSSLTACKQPACDIRLPRDILGGLQTTAQKSCIYLLGLCSLMLRNTFLFCIGIPELFLSLYRIKQANFEKIVILPICYLFNGIRFHFHLCVTGIPADLHTVNCL